MFGVGSFQMVGRRLFKKSLFGEAESQNAQIFNEKNYRNFCHTSMLVKNCVSGCQPAQRAVRGRPEKCGKFWVHQETLP